MHIQIILNYICTACNTTLESNEIKYKCPECAGLLLIEQDLSSYKEELRKNTRHHKFWDYDFAMIPIKKDYIVSLGEGGSPCRLSKKLGEICGIKHLLFKDETQNPTNSFKDRPAALLISHARSEGYQKVVCASNGNQGASIAAYTSLEGMESVNIIPKKIDIGKHAQIIAYNSKVITSGELIDDAIRKALKYDKKKYYQATPEFNPLTIEAQKTISLELFNQLESIDAIIIPMGSGGLLVSIWKGFRELVEIGLLENLPRLIGVQAQFSSPIINKFNKKIEVKKGEDILETHALGILVKNPQYLDLAINAIKDSGGSALAIPENVMLTSAEDLAKNEGLFAEPSSALTTAALSTLIQEGVIHPEDHVVCLITGSGLKTPYVLEALSSRTKTVQMGGILSTKLKILSQISISRKEGIYGSRLKEIIGSISLPAIYQHLKELETRELIERKKAGKNVLYFITEKGKKVLEALDILITLL